MAELSYKHALDIEYFEMNIERLVKERKKITYRGRLNELEDRRLDEIDSEVDHWIHKINGIYELYDDVDE